MSATYDLGDSVTLTYLVKNAAGVLTDATVALALTPPNGVDPAPTVNHPSTGTYTASFQVDQAGTWVYRFTATGTVTDAEPGDFYVTAIPTANVYTTLPELKVALQIKLTDTTDDDELQDAILTASRAVSGDCQRNFHQVTETRTLVPHDWYTLRLGPYNDLVSVTTLKTDASGDGTFETTWASTDYQLLTADGTPNVNAGPEQRPYQRVKAVGTQLFPIPWSQRSARTDLVQINGVWGWPAVPDRIRRATRMLAEEQFKLNTAPFGVAGFDQWGPVRVRDNPKYQRLIAPYQLVPVAVA